MATSASTPIRSKAGVSFAARLAFESIYHDFNGENATLNGISLTAEPGEVLCLLGPSGSGKTTLLRIAAGIEVQKSGRVLLNDTEIAGPSVFLPPERRAIGLMFQDFALFPHMTVLDNVRFGLTALSQSDSRKQAMVALRRVGLERYADSYPHLLSGGEQQRAALARALAPRPAVLLMDEPFSGLDSRLKDAIRADTLAILRESKATAIIVTHDAEEAMRMADRIALLRRGRIVQVGTAQDLYLHPSNLFAARFFSELNVFEVTVANGMIDTPIGRFEASGFRDGAQLDVAVRLTEIDVHKSLGNIPARIVSRRFVGNTELLELAVEGHEETVRARVRAGHLRAGLHDVVVNVKRDDVLVFEREHENA